jgi:lipoprotein-anchoring transpeptidase ErfK/SrfK
MAQSEKEIEHIKKQVERPVKFNVKVEEKSAPEREQEIAEQPYGYPIDQEVEKPKTNKETTSKKETSPSKEQPGVPETQESDIEESTPKEKNDKESEQEMEEEPTEETGGEKKDRTNAAGDFAKRTMDGIKKALSKIKFTIGGIPVNLWDIILTIGIILMWIAILACFGIMLVGCTGTCGKKNAQQTNIVRDNSLINCLLANTGDKEALAKCFSGSSQTNLDNLKKAREQAPEKAKPIIDKLIDKYQQLVNAQAKGDNTKVIIDEIYALTTDLKKYYPDINSSTSDLSNVNKTIGKILVKKGELKAEFYDTGGNKMGSAPINIGISGRDTPTGNFIVENREENTSGEISSSIYNVSIGHEWIQFYGNYGFHGDKDDNQGSLRPTYGCVRMYNSDLKTIYPFTETGITMVEIVN